MVKWAVAALAWSALVCTTTAQRVGVVVTVLNGENEEQRFFGELAEEVGTVVKKQDDASLLPMVWDEANPFGCDISTLSNVPEKFALVVKRGECPFSNKTINAESSGASAVLVVNTVESLYNETTNFLYNPCSLDCSISESTSQSECEKSCPSSYCSSNPLDSAPFCCVVATETVRMQVGNGTSIPSVFIGLGHARTLLEAAGQGKNIQLFLEDDNLYPDGSMIFILLIGTGVTAAASYRAARAERVKASWLWKGELTPLETASEGSARRPAKATDEEIESVTLSIAAVGCFFVLTTGTLVGLFLLARAFPRETVIAVQVLFGLSAWFAFSYFMVQPVVRLAWKKSSEVEVNVGKFHLGTADQLIGSVVALTTVIVWFVFRHSGFAWVLLDLLAASVCCLFLVSIRLPNLQLACYMLLLFFVYDIFMVFISPLLTGGRSIMVDVAKAGATPESSDEANLVCNRVERERMPMLFLIPRFSDDEYALLGLGDVFIPGLMMTYACRFDYLKAEAVGKRVKSWFAVHKYFVPICISYFVGLGITLLANLFGFSFGTNVKGQPALLYLVPFTTLTFIGCAKWYGDLSNLWKYNYEELTALMLRSGEDSAASSQEEEVQSPSETSHLGARHR